MKIPHPALMRMYGTDDVFFKKASAEPRVTDQIGRLFAGELLEKLALPSAPGMKAPALAAPRAPLRSPSPVMTRGPNAPPVGGAPTAPTTATARPQTQMAPPTPGALGSPPAAAASPFAAHDATNRAKMRGPASAPGGAGWAPPPGVKPATAPSAAAPTQASPAGAPATPAAKGGTPWNKILAVGGALGAGALGVSALGKGLNFLKDDGTRAPADYGYAPGGFQVPMGVGAYGAPQPGSRMM